ncbi:hypothetical protein Cylst_3519 [Cylindrospermum stagnale PCC 7417]|uniref:Uncharacterized protein n=1 Tax=Cylindrospermum stagnale PCC 7417 TaxID=56107 RepID=K9WZN1_9NOST|nr:hypothetical protein [Cylindrospermum stagnale]AFZ25658.1 hypothetical protein Cylst_3519 [Cylindrospermum stagnale PCC 7417]
MQFQFEPIIQSSIDAGKYEQVFSKVGVPLSMARDPVTGRFVAHAIGANVNDSPLVPLVSTPNFLKAGVQMYQNQQNFTAVMGSLQTIQSSLGVLQATTALIGVGTVAGVALTAVNLHQTLKLRKEVEQMRLEVKNGFIDLKQALKDQGAEIRQLIEQVAQDIKFEQHRTILVRAYGLFIQAINRFRSAMQLQDISRRNAEIDAVRGMLFEALADYTNPHLLAETCAAGQLRRLECSWAIEQTIIATYQVQNEVSAVCDRLLQLQDKICEDAITVINRCESDDELDFLFPEITRIRNHDLVLINSWQNHVDWLKSLSPSELKLLNSSDFNNSETNQTLTASEIPPEQLIYENLAEKSHFYSLRDQLLFMFEPDLRREYEIYVSQQAADSGYKTLVKSNLQQASNLTVANFFHYFNIRDESENKLFKA